MKTEIPENTKSESMFKPNQQEHSDSHTPNLLTHSRPRGRPPGSKNKPKPPLIITTDPPPMSPHVFQLPPGSDIIHSTTQFCRKRRIGLTIFSGNGSVSNVTLKNPPGSTVTFHGDLELLSLTATILPDGFEGEGGGNGGFCVWVAGPQGQVVGGLVVGPLVAAGTVYLVGATFNNPVFSRLGHGNGDESSSHQAPLLIDNNNNSSGGDGRMQIQQQQQQQQHY